jgi:hypothetical protein
VDQLCDNIDAAADACTDVLKRLTATVDAEARHTMKLELRQNLLDRFVRFRKKDEDDLVEVIMKEKMQQRLAVYLASLKSKSK